MMVYQITHIKVSLGEKVPSIIYNNDISYTLYEQTETDGGSFWEWTNDEKGNISRKSADTPCKLVSRIKKGKHWTQLQTNNNPATDREVILYMDTLISNL